jgi:hypothetical protein
MKAYEEGGGGGRGLTSFILNFGTRCRWLVNFTSWPLYSRRKNPKAPTEKQAELAPQTFWRR